jgi:hypothetical protein
MGIPRRFGLASFACLTACSAAVVAGAQKAAAPALDQILSRVEANTEQYEASVPSFLCDEHIISQELHDGKLKHETTVDGVFRVTRSTTQAGALKESREVKAIDGKPSSNAKISMPITFSGGFSGALDKFLSADHRQCFDYQPDPAAASPAGTAAFTFSAREAAAKDPACASIQPGTTGKFVIDSAAMQVTHIERTVPQTVGKDREVRGTASVDFAPVTLNGRSFWLPITISGWTTETPKTNAFRFTAHYSNYHRFAANSTIVPVTSNDSATTPPTR